VKLTRIDAIQKDPRALMRGLKGYYKCPRGPNREWLGPVVGYTECDPVTGLQYVGDVYLNFAPIEQYRFVYDEWAVKMIDRLRPFNPTVVMGMPMGGILVADSIARALACRVIYADRKVVALATSTSREKSILILGRHDLDPDDRVIVADDVLNNFRTTGEGVALVGSKSAMAVAIAGFFNRSLHRVWFGVPVVSLIHDPLPQYQQEDPEVAAEIEKGNVAWKPKDEWDRLEAAMLAHPEPEQT